MPSAMVRVPVLLSIIRVPAPGAVKSEPDNLELRGVLAQACLNIRQYYCALEQDQQINKINPDSAQAHMLSGEALDGLRRTDEAIAEFRLAEKVSPNEPNVHFGLGYLLSSRTVSAQTTPEATAVATAPGAPVIPLRFDGQQAW